MGDDEQDVGEDVANVSSLPKLPEPGEAQDVALGGTLSSSEELHGALSLSTSLVVNHLHAAAFFARQSAAMEVAHDEHASEDARADHRAYVIGSVFAAVAFLEAAINEVFEYNLAKWATVPKGWEEVAMEKYSSRRKKPKEPEKNSSSKTTLMKYQLALELSGKLRFVTAEDADFVDADDLIGLRNNLVHYRPTKHTQTMSEPVPEAAAPDLEKMLRQKVKMSNPLYPPHSHFLHELLSHDCAQWAVQAALTFADAFFASMGLQPPYDQARERLDTH